MGNDKGKADLADEVTRLRDELSMLCDPDRCKAWSHERVDEKTVRNLFRQHVEEMRQKIAPISPGILGIDELHLLGGHERLLIEPIWDGNKGRE